MYMNGVWQAVWPEVPCSMSEGLEEMLRLVTRGIIRLVNQAGLKVDSARILVMGVYPREKFSNEELGAVEQQHVLIIDRNTGLGAINFSESDIDSGLKKTQLQHNQTLTLV